MQELKSIKWVMNELEDGLTIDEGYQYVCNALNQNIERVEPVEEWLKAKRELELMIIADYMRSLGYYIDCSTGIDLWKLAKL